MDWQFKHFNQEAVYSASRDSLLEAARAVIGESFGAVEDTPEGFTARGRSGWHAATAKFRIEPAADGTRLAVELLVKRSGLRSYMLVDIGGYYNGVARRWLTDIGRRLGQAPVSISRPSLQHGCLTGCVVYLVAGTVLSVLAIPLDRWVLLPRSSPLPGPAMMLASVVGFAAGIAAFFYALNPEAPIWSGVRGRLPGPPNPNKP
jgi:hypothetical protein